MSGLTLREAPSINATKLMTIPYGAALRVQNEAGSHQTKIEAVPACKTKEGFNPAVVFSGDFAKVTFDGKTGYLFDGYLSKMPVIPFSIIPGVHYPSFKNQYD